MTIHEIAKIPDGFDSPFAYSSLTHVMSLWRCSLEVVEEQHRALIGDYQLVASDGTALVAVSYQSYLADYGSAALISRELELGPVVVPPEAEPPSIEDFLAGNDQRGMVGIWPAAVYCDCEPAINAGRAIYGEPKFSANFEIDVPAPNAPGTSWSVRATTEDRVCQLNLQLEGASTERPGQPIVNYGRRNTGEVVSSRWDIFVGGHLWGPETVRDGRLSETLTGGHDARHRDLLDGRCVQVREHRSPVVAQRSRPFHPIAIR